MLTTLEIWLLAVALAMDCLSVSVALGLVMRQLQWRPVLSTALFFGTFQALMPLLGWWAVSYLQQTLELYQHWIAFAMLLYLGVGMIRNAFREQEERRDLSPASLSVQIQMAFATSIDALAVGVSFACTGYTSLTTLSYPLVVIGLVSFVLTMAGLLAGISFSQVMQRHKLRPELLGGIVLIGIGLHIVFRHCFV